MFLSRTRKENKNIETFYKEAGLDKEIENIIESNHQHETLRKKERMILKKKSKQDTVSKLEVKVLSEKVVTDSQEDPLREELNCPKVPNLSTRSSTESTLPLDKLLHKMSIIQILEAKTVCGCYGHSTIFFKRPIIEGQYYIEFKILKSNLNNFKANIKSEPSVRIGICPLNYPKNTPLGQDISVGFKSTNGAIVSKGEQYDESESFKEDDTIGLGLSFSPPHKYQNKEELWEGSQIIFTKNGKIIQKCSEIYQSFYCPAFSLYNYASVEIRYNKESFEYCLEGYKPYSVIFNEGVNYETLKSSAFFSHPLLDDI